VGAANSNKSDGKHGENGGISGGIGMASKSKMA
jgi:hypothetical protein